MISFFFVLRFVLFLFVVVVGANLLRYLIGGEVKPGMFWSLFNWLSKPEVKPVKKTVKKRTPKAK
jgi:hypothetical protein